MRLRLLWSGIALAGCGMAAWCWWLCACSPDVAYLGRHAPAEWIVYPKPPSGQVQGWTDGRSAPELKAVFRKALTLPRAPSSATLKVRAFRQASLWINGSPILLPNPERSEERRV